MTLRQLVLGMNDWFVSSLCVDTQSESDVDKRIDWLRVVPFFGMHAACAGVVWVGASWTAVGVAAGLYVARMFAITAFYHRYFSHRAFKTSRAMQFAFALLGSSAVQRGPLWWAAHHRHHHRHADTEKDRHSPCCDGFFWSHMGWFLARDNFTTHLAEVPDLASYPELRFLDRFDTLVPIGLAVGLYFAGAWLHAAHPELGTTGPQMLVWGFFISTVMLFHATVTINSLAHGVGKRRYETRDRSRNSFWLALLTFGEGWHNNHHHFPGSARQGFYWWEVDLSYYGLKLLSWLGLVWGLRLVPVELRDHRRVANSV